MITQMDEQVEKLMNVMKNDYYGWSQRPDPHGVSHQMWMDYCDKLHVIEGRQIPSRLSLTTQCVRSL